MPAVVAAIQQTNQTRLLQSKLGRRLRQAAGAANHPACQAAPPHHCCRRRVRSPAPTGHRRPSVRGLAARLLWQRLGRPQLRGPQVSGGCSCGAAAAAAWPGGAGCGVGGPPAPGSAARRSPNSCPSLSHGRCNPGPLRWVLVCTLFLFEQKSPAVPQVRPLQHFQHAAGRIQRRNGQLRLLPVLRACRLRGAARRRPRLPCRALAALAAAAPAASRWPARPRLTSRPAARHGLPAPRSSLLLLRQGPSDAECKRLLKKHGAAAAAWSRHLQRNAPARG